MVNLPVEVIADILSRISVKSLLRFRSTCKSWRSLIDSPYFIFLHLNKSIQSNSNNNIIFRHHSDLYEVDFHSLEKAYEVSHPLMCYGNRIKVLGSYNGLICISNVAEDIAFWNPSIRNHRILPHLPSDRYNRRDHDTTIFAARVYGFGYDSFTDDYKLLRISYFVDLNNRSFNSQVKLYSLRNDAWKSLPNMPYALCCARTMGVFVGGALHWVVTRKLLPDQPDLIVAFDLRFESFREVPLPETGNVNGNLEMEVALLGGCLCIIENGGSKRIDVWVMKEYGSVESWCKLLSLTEPHHVNMRSLKSVKPLAYSRDGDTVLLEQDHRKLCWYNLESKDVSYVKVSGLPKSIEGMICVGTLVPPTLPCSKSDTKQQKLGHEKTSKKKRYSTNNSLTIWFLWTVWFRVDLDLNKSSFHHKRLMFHKEMCECQTLDFFLLL